MIHLTLNTGHSALQPRAVVPDEVIAQLMPLLDSQVSPIPGVAPWHFGWGAAEGGATFDIRRGNDSAVICGVAWTPEGAAAIWPELERMHMDFAETMVKAGLPESMLQMPEMPEEVPWLAVLILPAGMMLTSPSDIGWMGDFERCLAWTLYEKFNPRKTS